jgi:hypothetical protein
MTTEVNPTPTEGATHTGRPRPQDTIARDNAVYETLVANGPLTRSAVAEKMSITPSLAYMSLFRLARDGRVRRTQGGEGDAKSHTWEAVPEAPAPAV